MRSRGITKACIVFHRGMQLPLTTDGSFSCSINQIFTTRRMQYLETRWTANDWLSSSDTTTWGTLQCLGNWPQKPRHSPVSRQLTTEAEQMCKDNTVMRMQTHGQTFTRPRNSTLLMLSALFHNDGQRTAATTSLHATPLCCPSDFIISIISC